MNPTERAVFLLREVFDYDYAEIARIVDKNEANCRQLARRARQYISARRPRFEASAEEQQRLTRQFLDACIDGDLPGLLNLLEADIILWSDGGGKAITALKPIYGAEKVARFFLGVAHKTPANYTVRLAWVNGQPAIIGYETGRPDTVITLQIAAGHIQAVYAVRNPDKLQRIPLLSK